MPSSRRSALIVCLLAVLLSGLLHGYLEGRWADRPDLERIGSRLADLSAKVGDWELAAESPLDKGAQQMLQCYGSVVREYWKPATGQRVNVAVLFGPRGPIAVHTPEVCYSSQGTIPAGTASVATVNGQEQAGELWKVQFRTRQTETPHLEVWYAWSDGGPWQAAKLPRVWMTDRLYKIQVAGRPAQPGESIAPVQNFLQSFLPELNKTALRRE